MGWRLYRINLLVTHPKFRSYHKTTAPWINLYSQGQHKQALEQANVLLQKFPSSNILHNICGVQFTKGFDQLDASVEAYTKLSIKPNFAEAYYNMGNVLKEQGKLEEAIEATPKPLSIKPDFAEAYNNKGIALKSKEARRGNRGLHPKLSPSASILRRPTTTRALRSKSKESWMKP